MENSKINENKISSIFDFNIPRKINYNKSFNKSTNENSNAKIEYNQRYPKFIKISKFNPYDKGILKTIKKENIYKTGIKEHKSNNCIYIHNTKTESENKENDFRKSNILIQKDKKYSDSNKKLSQNLMLKFNTPKINLNLDNYNNKNTPEYIIKIKKQKNQYFSDLKNASNKGKIISTNFSSNVSYNNYNEKNHYYYENDKNNDSKIKESSFDKKINEINIQKNIDKAQIIPDFIKSLQKYINLTSIPKNKNKSRHKKDKLKTNKSANNIKITNKKYISTNDFKSETTKIKNKFESKDKIIENIGIKKNKSFINKLLNGFCCCNEIED